jgi:hypothetical protein
MRITAGSAAVLGLLLLVGPALAQTRSGGGGGTSSGGFGSSGGSGGSGFGSSSSSGGFGTSGFGGSGTGGFGSSSSGSFTGGAGSNFTGGGGGNFTGGTGTSSSFLRGGTRTTPSTDPTYRYNANPLGIGLASPTSSSAGSQYLRQNPYSNVIFGNPLFSNLGTTTTGLTGGTATLGLGGTGTLGTSSNFMGANSLGIRRAPAYTVGMAFDPVPPRPLVEIRADLQQVIANSSRLPSRGNIRVTVEGGTVVLQGRVTNDRERRLAEALLRLTPGVRDVRNDITVGSRGGG